MDRFFLLEDVLKYCTREQDNGKPPIFKTHERFAINQERAKLLRDDHSYKQASSLELKIQKTFKTSSNEH